MADAFPSQPDLPTTADAVVIGGAVTGGSTAFQTDRSENLINALDMMDGPSLKLHRTFAHEAAHDPAGHPGAIDRSVVGPVGKGTAFVLLMRHGIDAARPLRRR